ncbi:kinesin-like protein KIF24 [Scleropages formosus]|uniref:kinesin-like protein KIF24 n=1 Tax=Scleropages formosus TaxID=113540 RepID=UPI0008790B2E|nr:kinesin-like protein KIF24 [Scleropages formosus]
MTSFLYECLREVGLQRYYAQFSSLGLSHPAQLSKLTMSDYPQLGVHPMEDRTRLFYLVQVMKALDEEQNDECEDHGDYDEERGVMDFPTAPRRRLYFGPSSPESQLDILAEDCKTNTSVDESHTMRYAAQRDKEAGSCHTPVMTANQRRKACTSTETPKSTSCINRAAMGRHIYKDGETPQNRKTKKQAGCLKEMHRKVLMQQQSAPVYKVKHSQGYNYGLPNSSPVSSTRYPMFFFGHLSECTE